MLGTATAWITDFDLFAAWELTIGNHALGLVFTGLVVAAAAYSWQPLLAFFQACARKQGDEAATLEKPHNLRRAA